ncbi:hypothetical protein [Nocardioides bruguierae]|uniref:hypothetical protein n=1 Tax=Nocardioides bruguierae TaxID=2945102 RepID=UPI0020218455|nr:hypothetical protein [Nocardioides bruguierae]MCL8026376.1 hypothetical protein [Nocardioides bruguierae]
MTSRGWGALLHARRERRRRREAALAALQEDYLTGLEEGDPHVLESARTYGDGDHRSWDAEVRGARLILVAWGLLALAALVYLLVGLLV